MGWLIGDGNIVGETHIFLAWNKRMKNLEHAYNLLIIKKLKNIYIYVFVDTCVLPSFRYEWVTWIYYDLLTNSVIEIGNQACIRSKYLKIGEQ